MSTLDRMNDRYGNLNRTLSDFTKKHGGEAVLYSSAGAMFRRKGDTPFKKWTVFLNRRGNLIVSDKRCYFSNPVISGHLLMFLMLPISIIPAIMTIFLILVLVFALTGSLPVALAGVLLLSPLVFLLVIAGVLNLYQRLPIEVDIEHQKMKRMYLGSYMTISRPSPLFSCFDGKYSYHFLGYRKIDDGNRERIERIFHGN